MVMTDVDPARTDALAAAVPDARGWFRPEGASGAVNLRSVMALQTVQYDDLGYRVQATGSQSYALAVGPYETAEEADAACSAVLSLSYDDANWPTSTPPA